MRNLARATAVQVLRLVPGPTALGLKRDLRDAAWLEEVDSVVLSFPKSGRTFVRAMVARLYQRKFGIDDRKLLEFGALKRAPAEVPRLLFTHDGDPMQKPDAIGANPAAYAAKRCVLIARHPGDVAVSLYHHLKHRSRVKARQRLADPPLESFIWSDRGGVRSITAFLNCAAALPGVTILRYEDFLTDPRQSLRKLADSIGLEVTDEDIGDAVEFGSLANLRKLEEEGYFTSSRLRRARKGDAKSGKVRSGKSGGYRAELQPDDAARIDAYVREHLDPRFGYSA